MFITFEGGEGSGKSWQTRALYRKLCRLAVPSVLIHEPGSTPLGERLSRLLKWGHIVEISPLSELMLFNAARAQLVADVIHPGLGQGKIVICDRFADSTIAYQGYGRGLDVATVLAVNKVATGNLNPDLTILLDIPVEKGLARKSTRETNRFEKEEIAFHKRVRTGFLSLSLEEPDRFLVIDATQSKSMIAQIIWEKVALMLSRVQD